jgi:deazaflavin-dependent oxidoreductase (nitroreductase family)
MSVELTPSGSRGAHIPRLMMRTMNVPVQFLLRVLRGKGVRVAGQQLLLLTTVGAKTGRQHTVPLAWFSDEGGGWIVVASFGGMPKHPAWYVNLARNPDHVWVEVSGHKVRVQAESLRGDEREAAWARIVSVAPLYQSYKEKTDREIPLVRLKRPTQRIDSH